MGIEAAPQSLCEACPPLTRHKTANHMNLQEFIATHPRKSGFSNIALLVLIALVIVFSIWSLYEGT